MESKLGPLLGVQNFPAVLEHSVLCGWPDFLIRSTYEIEARLRGRSVLVAFTGIHLGFQLTVTCCKLIYLEE